MTANLKIIFFVILGVVACFLSIFLNQFFNKKEKLNLQLQYHMNNVVDQIVIVRDLEQHFIQNADDSKWTQLNENMNLILYNLDKTIIMNKNYQQEIEDLRQTVKEYQYVMKNLYKPAMELKVRKKALQEIGLSFSTIIEEKILDPYKKEEGLKLFNGESIDPFKTRIKDEAHELLAYHLKQQVILYDFILNLDIEEYKNEKYKISKALDRHESQLYYMSILMGTESSIQATLNSLGQKLNILIDHENAIIKNYNEIIEINKQLMVIGDKLSVRSAILSTKIVSDRKISNKKIRTLNSFIILGILISLSILGTLLAVDIITFIKKLKLTKLKLNESEIKYRNIIEQANDSMLLIDFDGNIVEANNYSCKTFGYTYDELISLNIEDLDINVTKDNHKHLLWDQLVPGKPITIQSINKRKDGTTFPVEIKLGKIEINGTNYILGLSRDITGRKKIEDKIRQINIELEERIKERTYQLEESNKDLELFAYSISHDLRAPLRAIDGFSKIILEKYNNKLDADGKHYLDRICAGSQRMESLIDDILELSRSKRKKIKLQKVNLSKLAKEAALTLKENDPDRNVEFDIQKDQIVNGDFYLLNTVLENLIANAWKFTKYNNNAKITFGFIKKKKEKFYFIKDNGVGFNTKYSDKLFMPFQRLHSEKQYPGTGIGLASVKQAVKRHGGHVWAESEGEGKGATFYFSIKIIEGGVNE